VHKKRHTVERPFTCNVPGCSYSFKVKTDLRNHESSTHGTVFECHLCGSFIMQKNLKLHLQRHKTGPEGLLKCVSQSCKQTFTSLDDLRKHNMLEHKHVKAKKGNWLTTSDTLGSDSAIDSQQNPEMHSKCAAEAANCKQDVAHIASDYVKEEIEEEVFD
jgi:Zinc finger, C2H2 type